MCAVCIAAWCVARVHHTDAQFLHCVRHIEMAMDNSSCAHGLMCASWFIVVSATILLIFLHGVCVRCGRSMYAWCCCVYAKNIYVHCTGENRVFLCCSYIQGFRQMQKICMLCSHLAVAMDRPFVLLVEGVEWVHGHHIRIAPILTPTPHRSPWWVVMCGGWQWRQHSFHPS